MTTDAPPVRFAFWTQGRGRRWLVIAWWLALAGLWYAVLARKWGGVFSPAALQDFVVYWNAGKDILSGHSVYAPRAALPFIYPPFSAAVFIPLSVMPLGAAKAFFVLGTLACLAFTLWALHQHYSVPWAVLLVAPLTMPYLRSELLGQINPVIFALLVADMFFMPRRYRGWLTGLAAGLKLTPALFGLVFLVERDWKAIGRAVAGGLATLVLGVIASPSDSVLFWTKIVRQPSQGLAPVYVDNQSLAGLLARLWPTPTGYAPSTLVLPLTLVVLVLTVVAAWRAHALDSHLGMVLAVGIGALLISPISWSHHCLWAVIFALVAWAAGHRWTAVAGLFATLIEPERVLQSLPGYLDKAGLAKGELVFDVGLALAQSTYTLLMLAALVVLAVRPAFLQDAEPHHRRPSARRAEPAQK